MTAKNQKHFSDSFLKSLKLKGNRLEIGDTECKGLVVRLNKNGSKSFYTIFRVVGDGGVGARGRPLQGKQQRIFLGHYPEISIDTARAETLLIRGKALGLTPNNIV